MYKLIYKTYVRVFNCVSLEKKNEVNMKPHKIPLGKAKSYHMVPCNWSTITAVFLLLVNHNLSLKGTTKIHIALWREHFGSIDSIHKGDFILY